jgi:hypothetical protein
MCEHRKVDISEEMFKALPSLQRLLEEAGADAARYGVGLKETSSEITDAPALIVYAPNKRAPQEVSPSHLVPREHRGFLTDVVECQNILLADTGKYDPLLGGIEIGPFVDEVFGNPTSGTLGAVVRRKSDGHKMLLTCEHIVDLRENHQSGQPQPNGRMDA